MFGLWRLYYFCFIPEKSEDTEENRKTNDEADTINTDVQNTLTPQGIVRFSFIKKSVYYRTNKKETGVPEIYFV